MLVEASELAEAIKEAGIDAGRRRKLASDPAEYVRLGQVQQPLELGEVLVGHSLDLAIGEPAHDEVHFARAAMPGAEQRALAPRIEFPGLAGARARDVRSCV